MNGCFSQVNRLILTSSFLGVFLHLKFVTMGAVHFLLPDVAYIAFRMSVDQLIELLVA